MAKTRADYVAEGRASYNHPSRVSGQITDTTMPLFGEGKSWQARAFAQGWREEHQAAKVTQTVTMNATTEEGQHVILAMPVTTVEKIRTAMLKPSEQRREWQINAMLDGYTEALLWSSSDVVDGEDIESLEGYDLSEKAVAKALETCARFYDANRTDLAAYADMKTHAPEYGAYECIGHDLWLTTAGHGAGFWDRGMGRVGERLSAQCGYGKPFPHHDAYVGDDGLVHIQ